MKFLHQKRNIQTKLSSSRKKLKLNYFKNNIKREEENTNANCLTLSHLLINHHSFKLNNFLHKTKIQSKPSSFLKKIKTQSKTNIIMLTSSTRNPNQLKANNAVKPLKNAIKFDSLSKQTPHRIATTTTAAAVAVGNLKMTSKYFRHKQNNNNSSLRINNAHSKLRNNFQNQNFNYAPHHHHHHHQQQQQQQLNNQFQSNQYPFNTGSNPMQQQQQQQQSNVFTVAAAATLANLLYNELTVNLTKDQPRLVLFNNKSEMQPFASNFNNPISNASFFNKNAMLKNSQTNINSTSFKNFKQTQQQQQQQQQNQRHANRFKYVKQSTSLIKNSAPYNTTQYIMHDYSKRRAHDQECPNEQQQFSFDWDSALSANEYNSNTTNTNKHFSLTSLNDECMQIDQECTNNNNNNNNNVNNNDEIHLHKSLSEQNLFTESTNAINIKQIRSEANETTSMFQLSSSL